MKYKNVLVLGFGVTGQAVVNFLNYKKIKHTVIDQRKESEFDSKLIKKYKKDKFTNFIFESQEIKNIKDFDLVMTSPGVSYKNQILQSALKKKIPIKNDVTYFIEEWQKIGKTIGVTGSNGKSTIATLIYEMIKSSGRETILVGNIGKSPLDYLTKKPKKNTIAVIELSSYQLETFKSEHAVDVAILANLSSNHLDHYDGSFQKYADAKSNIANPKKTKLIINLDNEETQKYLGAKLKLYKNNLYAVSLKTNIDEATTMGVYTNSSGNLLVWANNNFEFDYLKGLKIFGIHNVYNIAMAILAFDLIGLDFSSKTEKAIRNFKGLEHRVEFVREINNVKYINDSKSTAPDATRAAIETFGKDKNIILIGGGLDKDMDLSVLSPYFDQYIREVVILPGDIDKKVIKICQKTDTPFSLVNNMKEAVLTAKKIAKSGEIVLFSPSSASLNMFKSFEHRGQEFKKEVNNLK